MSILYFRFFIDRNYNINISFPLLLHPSFLAFKFITSFYINDCYTSILLWVYYTLYLFACLGFLTCWHGTWISIIKHCQKIQSTSFFVVHDPLTMNNLSTCKDRVDILSKSHMNFPSLVHVTITISKMVAAPECLWATLLEAKTDRMSHHSSHALTECCFPSFLSLLSFDTAVLNDNTIKSGGFYW